MTFAVRPNWSVGIVSLAAIPDPLEDNELAPGTAQVQVDLDENGDGSYDEFGGATAFPWFDPNSAGIGSNYWVRMTINSGTGGTFTGTTGTWLSLATPRTWTLSRNTVGNGTRNVTLAIATDSGGANIVATRTFVMYVELA